MDISQFAPYDAADYLDSDEVIAEYLNLAASDPDPDILVAAIADVARARSIATLAHNSGLKLETVSKALKPGSKPSYETVVKLLNALNIKIGLYLAETAS